MGFSNQKNSNKNMTVSKSPFGKMPDGTKVSQYTLINANNMKVSLLDYGATVKEILIPDRNGKFTNVSLGFSNLDDYRAKSPILVVRLVGMQTGLHREVYFRR